MTPRQEQVYAEVCKGKSNKQIARELGISDATVKLHITELLREHGAHTRYELIAGSSRTSTKVVSKAIPVLQSDEVFTSISNLLSEVIRLRARNAALEQRDLE